MTALLDAFPQPLPIKLQGRPRLVSQFQVKHLAQLDAFYLATSADAIRLLDEGTITPGDRPKVLRDAYEAAEKASDHPIYSSPEGGSILFGTTAGLAFVLSLALRADPDPPNVDEVAALAGAITPAEWMAVERVLFGLDTLAELERRIDREIGVELPLDTSDDGRASWRKIVADLCETYHYTPAEVGELYLSQLRLLRMRGDTLDRGTPIPAGWTMAELDERVLTKRRAFWGDTDPLSEPQSSEPQPSEPIRG